MTPHTDISDPLFIEETDKFVEDFLNVPPTSEIDPTNVEEVFEYFKRTKNNKAPGDDGISNFIMKKLPLHVLERVP